MKYLIITAIYLLPLLGFAQTAEKVGIHWISINEAQEAMKKEPRKIIMDVYTPWCGPCKMMMKNTFTNEKLISYVNENYYAVKFNAESSEPVTFKGVPYKNPDYVEGKKGRNGVHEFSRYLQIRAYPSLVYLDENLNLLTIDVGYKKPNDVEKFLRFFKDDLHLTEQPQQEWESFNKSFQGTFE